MTRFLLVTILLAELCSPPGGKGVCTGDVGASYDAASLLPPQVFPIQEAHPSIALPPSLFTKVDFQVQITSYFPPLFWVHPISLLDRKRPLHSSSTAACTKRAEAAEDTEAAPLP